MTKRTIQWAVVGLIVAALALIVGRGLAQRRAQAPAPSTPAAQTQLELAPGDIAVAREADLAQGLAISGSLKAVDTAWLKARVAGELQGLTVREGDRVQAGQVLARIDPTEAQARLRQAQDQAEAAKAQIEIARRQWDNNKALVDQGFISKTALDTSWNNFTVAQSSHQAALAAVDVARKTLDDTVLRAPISGLVSQRLAQPGERVAVDARVIEIVDLRRLEVEATLSAGDSVAVRLGQTAQLQIEGITRPVTARVTRINPSAQAGSRGVLVYLAVEPLEGLRQGLFAQGTLSTGQTRQLAVPLSAVRTDKPSPYVQTVDGGAVAHRSVTPGVRGDLDGETWVGVQGLAAGTTVLRGHVGAIREGATVRVTPSAAPPATPVARAASSASPAASR